MCSGTLGGGTLRGRGTFERRWRGGVVQSRIHVVVSSLDGGWISEADDCLLSDNASIGGSMIVGELGRVHERDVIE